LPIYARFVPSPGRRAPRLTGLRAFRPADLRDWLVLALISDDQAQLTQLEIATQRDAAINDRLAAISLSERANFHATLWRIVGGAAAQK